MQKHFPKLGAATGVLHTQKQTSGLKKTHNPIQTGSLSDGFLV